MPRIRSSQRREKQERRLAILITSLAVLILGSLCAGYFWVSSGRSEVDAETLCPKSGPVAITVVLLDMTDPLTAIQQAAFKNEVERLKSQIPRQGEFEIYSIAPMTDTPLTAEFTACNPGTGADVPSPLIGNPTLADRIWRKKFSDRINEVIGRLITPHEEPTSPLFESVQSIATTEFGTERAKAVPKRLIIVSDLLQYVHEFSLYSGVPSFEDFKNTKYYRTVRSDLRGADVQILLIRRETRKHVQSGKLIEFWQKYIYDGNGILSGVSTLSG